MSTEKHDEGHKRKERMRELIEDVACCPKGHYCTLKEILCHAPRQTREIMQIKCVEKFKYERSEREQREIDWREAFDLWISEGHAVTFARLFHDGIKFSELYHGLTHPEKPASS